MLCLVFQILIPTGPIALCLIAPDGVQLIPFKQTHIAFANDTCPIIFKKSVPAVGQVERYLVFEITDVISPSYFKIPSPCFQFTHIHLGHIDTDDMRQLKRREHVVVIFPVIFYTAREPALEQAEVDTDIRGFYGFPSLFLRSQLGLIVPLFAQIGSWPAPLRVTDGGDVIIQSEDGPVAELSPRKAQLQIVYPLDFFQKTFLIDTPRS